MPFEPQNILVLYRQGNADSLAFAQHYQAAHGLNSNQLVPLPCSSNEVLNSYTQFQTEIETPLTTFVNSSPVDVRGFLVGYGVPGGFWHGGDLIATTSRLSRFGHVLSPQYGNPLYNRAVYEPYDEYDSQVAMIASRIDAPTLDEAKAIVNNAVKVIRRSVVRGTFYFDPYSVINDSDESDYFHELDDFGNLILPLLNLPTFTTKFWDEYTDVVVPRLTNDSFMWSWKSDRAGFSFFKPVSTPRVFLYNAADDDGYSLRDFSYRFLPALAMNAGYVASAGAMSSPSALGHLRPTPFFDALIRGAKVGEAFLAACPYLDWTVGLFGDPFVAIQFPRGSSKPVNTSTTSVFEQTHDSLASAIAYMKKKDSDLSEPLTSLLSFNEIDKAPIMSAFNNAETDHAGSWQAALIPVVRAFVNFWSGGSPSLFNQFLTKNATKISILLPQLVGEGLATVANQYETGFWKVETPITNSTTTAHKYHFELQIASDVHFTSISHTFSSDPTSVNYNANFTYEKTAGSFVAIPFQGVSSSFAGRRVRFSSPSNVYMAQGTVFYWRIRQVEGPTSYPYVSSKSIIFT